MSTSHSLPLRGPLGALMFGNFVVASWMNGVSPYASAFGGFSAGTYTFKVVATDNQGVTTTKSTTFTVTA